MFFILSKILSFLISPFTYVVFLLIWAWRTKKEGRRKKLVIYNLIFIFVFGNGFLFDEALRAWEMPTNNSRLEKYDVGIVLSGMANYDAKNDVIVFNRNADRLLQALPKFKNKSLSNLLITGGSGDIYHPENRESDLLKRYLKSIDYNTDSIWFENKSRNTYENAKFSKEFLDGKLTHIENKKLVIITSAAHMRRSLACFEKQGLVCDYIQTNKYSGPRKFQFEHCFIPQIAILKGWNHLAHEILGYVTYWASDKL